MMSSYCGEASQANELSFQELENIVCQLEIGTVVTKFFKNKQPDKRNLLVKKESRQIVWYKKIRNVYEGIGKLNLVDWAATLPLYPAKLEILPSDLTVDLREIKEIRAGKNSRDFERWNHMPEYAKLEDNRCFTVFYGHEFCLKSLSICGIKALVY